MLGPYHIARLGALGARSDLMAVEVASRSRVYKWDVVSEAPNFVRRTLFEVEDSSSIPRQELTSRVYESLSTYRPDTVFIPGWSSKPALASLTWCIANQVPAVLMSESTSADKDRILIKEAAKRQIVGCFQAGFVGGSLHREYLAALGMSPARVSLGYDVVDNEHFCRGAKKAQGNHGWYRAKFNLPQRYFLASSRFVPEKNLDGLLKAYALFKLRSRIHTKLVLIGDGELRPSLLQLRKNLGLEADVLIPGFVQYGELPVYYGLASAFVHISRAEPWGLVVNEAMAAGLPVVVSEECGCTSELVRDGENGFCVSSDDPIGIVEALLSIEADTSMAQRLGRRSREIVCEWTPRRFAEGACEAAGYALSCPALAPSPARQLFVSAMMHVL